MTESRSPDRGRSGLTRRQVMAAAGSVGGGVAATVLVGGHASARRGAQPEHFDAKVPAAWFDLALDLVRSTPGCTPPVASRAFGCAGVAAYEAVAPGSRRFRSLAGVLPDLGELPDGRGNLHWPLVANAALAEMMRSLFPTTSSENKASIDALEESIVDRERVPRSALRKSVEQGRDVASAVFEWSRTDGGHEGYLRNFPPDYVPPTGPGLWVPTPPAFQPALQPFWGGNRCAALASGEECPPGDPTPYSEDPASAFFAEAGEVCDTVNGLSDEQEEIARFWSDDPGATATPPGHSVAIATQILRRRDASLMLAAETYAKVGIAVTDAFVACWNAKYRYNLVRPVTYIRANIDPAWLPLLTTPPFPEYPSGHSVQSGAAFGVLADLFGDATSFTDHTHDDRGFAPREFRSFSQAAAEAAISRLYGGIHFRPAIERGLDQGRCIGEAISRLPFRETKRDHVR